jgi:hypothetical protein
MPRRPGLDVPGLLHHVMVRGIGGRDSFRNDNREAFLKRLSYGVDWPVWGGDVHAIMRCSPEGQVGHSDNHSPLTQVFS